MVKYKEYYEKMVSENKEVFDAFSKLHFEYSINQDKMQDKFNKEGGKVMDIIREYENRLCSNTERGMYNKYSSGLSEKFQNLIRSHFPLIDHVGLIIEKKETEKANVDPKDDNFTFKKIDL